MGVVLWAGTAFLTGTSSLTYLGSEDWTLESIWLLSTSITSVPSFLIPVLLFKLFVLMVAVYLKLTLLIVANVKLKRSPSSVEFSSTYFNASSGPVLIILMHVFRKEFMKA